MALEHRLCECHLGRKLRDHLPDELLAEHSHPITRALDSAFRTSWGWNELLAAIDAEQAAGQPLVLVRPWLERYGDRIEA